MMSLISCQNCGVVLDLNCIPEPEIVNDDGYSTDLNKCFWDGDKYSTYIVCPVCKINIFYKNGNKVY